MHKKLIQQCTGKPLFKENIEAWQHGPVVRNVYNTFSKFGRDNIDIKLDKENEKILNKIEENKEVLEVLNLTYDNFAIYTAWINQL